MAIGAGAGTKRRAKALETEAYRTNDGWGGRAGSCAVKNVCCFVCLFWGFVLGKGNGLKPRAPAGVSHHCLTPKLMLTFHFYYFLTLAFFPHIFWLFK